VIRQLMPGLLVTGAHGLQYMSMGIPDGTSIAPEPVEGKVITFRSRFFLMTGIFYLIMV